MGRKKKSKRWTPAARPTGAAPGAGLLRGRPGPAIALLLLGICVIGSLSRAWYSTGPASGIDFYHYWLVPQIARDHGGKMYVHGELPRLTAVYKQQAAQSKSLRQRRSAAFHAEICPNSSPLLYAVLSPLLDDDYDRSLDRFRLVALLLFCGGVVLLCRLLGFSWAETLAGLALLTIASDPTLTDARVGNVNRIQVALLALLLWLQSADDRVAWRQVAAGMLIAFAGLFKPNIAIGIFALGLLWLVERRWRKIAYVSAGGVVGGLVCLVAVYPLFGRLGIWIEWLAPLGQTLTTLEQGSTQGNFGLHTLLRVHGGVELGWLLTPVALGSAAAAIGWGSRGGQLAQLTPTDRARHATLVLGAGLLAGQLFTRLVFNHYFTLLTPVLFALLKPPGEPSEGLPSHLRLRLGLAAAGAAAVLMGPLHFLINDPTTSGVTLSVAGVLLLFCLTLYEIARPGATASRASADGRAVEG